MVSEHPAHRFGPRSGGRVRPGHRHRARAGWRQPRSSCRPGAGRGRRMRLRQERDRARHAADSGSAGPITSGRVLLDPDTPEQQDLTALDPEGKRHPGGARRPHRPDLPGADGRAVRAIHRRQPDHRGDPRASRLPQGRRARARDRPAARGRHSPPGDRVSMPIRFNSAAGCASGSASPWRWRPNRTF